MFGWEFTFVFDPSIIDFSILMLYLSIAFNEIGFYQASIVCGGISYAANRYFHRGAAS